MDAEDTTGAAKLVVDSAEEDLLDTELAKHGRTHDARLDSYVKSALLDQRSVDSRSGMKFLAVRVDVAVFRVNITPLLVGICPHQWRPVGLLAGRTLALGLLL